MSPAMNPAAPAHVPMFITPPGETDVLLVVMAIVLGLAMLGIGNLYFRLHSLPEQIAHKGQKLQFQIVAVLGLLALFTHQQILWVAGLLLALVDFPDFSTPMRRMTRAVEKIAGIEHAEPPPPAGGHGGPEQPPPVPATPDERGGGAAPKEPAHA